MSANEELDLEAFGEELRQWLGAYPLSMFPEPDLTTAAMLLKAGGMTLDNISASNMRHVVGQIAPKALALIDRTKAMREALRLDLTVSEKLKLDIGAAIQEERNPVRGPAYEEGFNAGLGVAREAAFRVVNAAISGDTP